MKPLVYIGGPHTSPDPTLNVRGALRAAQGLWETGLILPLVPAVSIIVVVPTRHADAVRLDVLAHCDAAYRLGGDPADEAMAAARDAETEALATVGLPVFDSEDDLLAWATGAHR